MTAALLSPGEARDLAYHRVPWSPRAWRESFYLAGQIPVQFVALAIPFICLRATGRWDWWAWSAWPVWLLALGLVFGLTPELTRLQRHRLRVTAAVGIPPRPALPPPLPRRLSMSAMMAMVRSPGMWREVAYHLLAGPALAVAAVVAIGMWLAGLLLTFCLAYGWVLPDDRVLARGAYPGPASHLLRLLGLRLDVYLTLAGVMLLIAAPWVTAGVRALDVSAARALLGPSRAEELQHRVEHLTQTRAGVVDAADAERRRLERDLHDGTQQRLVSLAMNLGMARAQAMTTEDARQAIAQAHEEAKAALAELRDLIRGLHPAVLEDRGLDAALSGIVARMRVPVRLTVDMPRRPPPVIEAVAYFVVSEGLANIAKHAQASQAEVVVQRAGDRLHIIISDDGVGGADPARGTGLAGLARRASSVDGTFEISSPPDGPTLLTVDLPCVR